MNWSLVIDPALDTSPVEMTDQSCLTRRAHGVLVKDVPCARRNCWWYQIGAPNRGRDALGVRDPLVAEIGETTQLREPECSSQLWHTEVHPNRLVLIGRFHPLVPKEPGRATAARVAVDNPFLLPPWSCSSLGKS